MADTQFWKGFSFPVKVRVEESQFKELQSNVKDIIEAISKGNKELKFMFNNIDSANVTELNTNITNISSEDGETVIDGPLLEMYDDTPTLRLKMGYDSTSSQFVFALYDELGVETFGIGTGGIATIDGDATINGETASDITDLAGNSVQQDTAYNTVKITPTNGIVATRSDNKARTSISGGELLIEKGDGTGTTWTDTVYIDSDGEAIFSGTVEIGTTSTIEIKAPSNIGQINYYEGTNHRVQMIYIPVLDTFAITTETAGDKLSIESSGDVGIQAGGAGYDVLVNGDNITLTSVTDVDLVPSGNLTINGSNGASGTFTTADSKTVTVTKGIITSIA